MPLLRKINGTITMIIVDCYNGLSLTMTVLKPRERRLLKKKRKECVILQSHTEGYWMSGKKVGFGF